MKAPRWGTPSMAGRLGRLWGGSKGGRVHAQTLGGLGAITGILAFSLREIRSHEGDVSRVCDMMGFVL